MPEVTATIDAISVTVPQGTSILTAAKKAHIKIPTLCYHPDLTVKAACRICLVEIKGEKRLKTACSTPVENGMEILTTSQWVQKERRMILELILANHPHDCLSCVRNGHCELQTLAKEMGIRQLSFAASLVPRAAIQSNGILVRDPAKCIKCGRCVEVCQEIQQIGAITFAERSENFQVTTVFDHALQDSPCVNCGQCLTVCPVGAIYEKDDTDLVWSALANSKMHVIVQIAPAVRVALGEEFSLNPGSIVTGKIITALRMLGFEKIFDTNFAADVTIMEEGEEFIERLKEQSSLPLLTSCCPGWIHYIESHNPELLNYVSSCKSPQQMFGALAKTYYAQHAQIEPQNLFVVSIMPCIAKKGERLRKGMTSSGVADVDAVLTTRELAKMLHQAGIDFAHISESNFDTPLGISTGAGAIFGATGGVMEAALRTVYEKLTGQQLTALDFSAVRGLAGIKTTTLKLQDRNLKVAVVNGIGNVSPILKQLETGNCPFHFIEVMCCPGGCIAGGGQPYIRTSQKIDQRMQAIYQIDHQSPLRKSHLNPAVQTLYKDYLTRNAELTHKLLHTSYESRLPK